ncbi:MAG: ATP synthase F1 subunit delta [Candidatus Korobacteraceae bacterium]
MAAVASRYARALVDVVMKQKIDPAAAVQQVKSIVGAIEQSPDLRKVWEAPDIPAIQKRNLLDAIGKQVGLLHTIRNFFAVLIDHQRIAMVERIARQFEIELDAELGFAEAQVTSARPLSDGEKRELESRVASITGKKVRARYAANSELLGGVMVQVGSTIYDGTVRGQLEKLRQQLVSS